MTRSHPHTADWRSRPAFSSERPAPALHLHRWYIPCAAMKSRCRGRMGALALSDSCGPPAKPPHRSAIPWRCLSVLLRADALELMPPSRRLHLPSYRHLQDLPWHLPGLCLQLRPSSPEIPRPLQGPACSALVYPRDRNSTRLRHLRWSPHRRRCQTAPLQHAPDDSTRRQSFRLHLHQHRF